MMYSNIGLSFRWTLPLTAIYYMHTYVFVVLGKIAKMNNLTSVKIAESSHGLKQYEIKEEIVPGPGDFETQLQTQADKSCWNLDEMTQG